MGVFDTCYTKKSGKKYYKKKLLLQCSKGHAPRYVTISELKRGQLCNECRRELMKKQTEEKYNIENLQKLINNVLPGYKVLDVKNESDGTQFGRTFYGLIQCPNLKHPPYWSSVDSFLKSHACRKCSCGLGEITDRKLTAIEEACKNNNLKFLEIVSYDKKEFKSFLLKVEDVEGYWYNVSIDTLRYRKFNKHNKFIEPSYIKHNIKQWCINNRPDYIFVEEDNNISLYNKCLFKYVGNEIEFSKEADRYFYVTPNNFIYDRAVNPLISASRKSYGSFLVRDYLLKNNIKYFEEKTFDDLLSNKGAHLFFDFYLTEYRTVIEVDGKQHFESICHFGGDSAFKTLQENDKIKDDYCKNNNIKMIRIPYYLYGDKRSPKKDYLKILEKL